MKTGWVPHRRAQSSEKVTATDHWVLMMYFLWHIFGATDQILFFTRDSIIEEASYTEEYLAA